MKKILLICLLSLFLLGCSSNAPQRIDSSGNLQSCTVFANKVECLMSNGNIYFVSQLRIAQITKYDSSAWKENVAYCPKDTILENITNISLQCQTKKVCYNGGWKEC